MPLLDPPRCPNCNSAVDLTELYRAALKAGETMIGRVVIACPVCGMKLRVLQVRAFLLGLLTFLLPLALMVATYIAAPVARGSRDYGIRMAVFIVVLCGATVLHRRNIPRLLTLRLLEDGEVVRFPLAPILPKVEESTAPSSALELTPVEENQPAWTCANCGEENPGNFAECWKCQTWKANVNRESGDPPTKVE